MPNNFPRGWRAVALVFFAVIAVLEFAETVNSLMGLLDLTMGPSFADIAPGFEWSRLIGSIVLSVAITIVAGATVYVLYARSVHTIRIGSVTGILLLLFGLYQILSGLLVPQAILLEAAIAAILYGLLGLVAIVLARRGATAN